MRAQKPAIVAMGTLIGIAAAIRGISDIASSIAPHGAHGCRKFARNADTGTQQIDDPSVSR